MLTTPYGALERELHTDVRLLLLTINEDTDLICDPEGSDCKGGCTKRFLVKHLKVAGYSASVCKSKWVSAGRVPGGAKSIPILFHLSMHRLLQFQSAAIHCRSCGLRVMMMMMCEGYASIFRLRLIDLG